MSTSPEGLHVVPPTARPVSAMHAIVQAFGDTLELLFRPFHVGRWIRLSIVCLFLGGGTPSAAFNWSLGSLPGDVGFQEWAGRVRQYVAQHLWLIILLTVLGLVLAFLVLYLRVVCRFVLVDAIFRRNVRVRRAWKETRALSRSYLRWLLAALAVVGVALVGGSFVAYPYLRTAAAAGVHSAAFWVALVTVLVIDVLVGLALAVVIVLTDDLAVPIMYAESVPLAAAWGKLWKHLRGEAGGFAVYVLLRFAVAVVTSVGVLLCLFPVLLGLFSGAIITGALVVIAMHVLGMLWSWNPFTITLAAAGLAVLGSLVLILLSVVGMPVQVFIQDFGVQFIAARRPSLGARLEANYADPAANG